METINNRFFTSFDINEHPIADSKINMRIKYFSLLRSFAENIYVNDFTSETLNEYKTRFRIQSIPEVSASEAVAFFLNPWRKKHLILLRYDLYLINCPFSINQYDFISAMRSHAARICTNGQYKSFCRFLEKTTNMTQKDKLINYGGKLRELSLHNRSFLSMNCRRIIITANMSSGKSTIINAITGKKITRTAQEVCTGNVSYIYSKPFEDEHIHMIYDKSTINADNEELLSNDWDKEKYISSYFNLSFNPKERFCLIDTPGVNSSMNRQHGRITRNTLEQRNYDCIIHVLNAQQLGTDEELAHLRWIKNNIQNRRVIFALNKVDIFKSKEDNIDSSIATIRTDLEKLGFENPVICPMSAYFAFLIKKKKLEIRFSEEEQDEYDLYVKKFNKQEYDLSRFYPNNSVSTSDDDATVLMKKCGFYGFEKIISGG